MGTLLGNESRLMILDVKSGWRRIICSEINFLYGSIKLNKILLLLKVTTLFLLASVFSSAYAEDYKIGFINARIVLEQSPQAKTIQTVLENEFTPREKEIIAAQKSLKGLEDKLAKDAAIMSESERNKIQRDMLNSQRDLKRSEDEFREDLQFRQNEELSKINQEILQAIQIVAKENNYDLVLSDGVLFASPKINMTNIVIEYLTKQAAN